ncbi:hypothetical protein JB92DRAFT_2827032 [Gautieria morchelliformis]|nr:hypothetical protein JB92DRAFT_2827032 [Gautieria morchelliformis]
MSDILFSCMMNAVTGERTLPPDKLTESRCRVRLGMYDQRRADEHCRPLRCSGLSSHRNTAGHCLSAVRNAAIPVGRSKKRDTGIMGPLVAYRIVGDVEHIRLYSSRNMILRRRKRGVPMVGRRCQSRPTTSANPGGGTEVSADTSPICCSGVYSGCHALWVDSATWIPSLDAPVDPMGLYQSETWVVAYIASSKRMPTVMTVVGIVMLQGLAQKPGLLKTKPSPPHWAFGGLGPTRLGLSPGPGLSPSPHNTIGVQCQHIA